MGLTGEKNACAAKQDVAAMRSKAIRSVLQAAQLNRQEWMSHVVLSTSHHTHVVLWTSEHFTLVLSCCQPYQRSPPCRYPISYMWSKTLEGSIVYRTLRARPGTDASSQAKALEKKIDACKAGQSGADTVSSPSQPA